MTDDGEVYFAVALGRYPNRFVLDGGLTVATGGEQRSCFVSRRAPDDPADMTIGPFATNFESYWNMLVVFGEFSENVKTTFDSQPDKYFYVEIECVERT